MHISTIYDRTRLINRTTTPCSTSSSPASSSSPSCCSSCSATCAITFIAAVTIPFAVLFAFGMMVLHGRSANLISIGAIDFGILVDPPSSCSRASTVSSPAAPGRNLATSSSRASPTAHALSSSLRSSFSSPSSRSSPCRESPGQIFAPMSVTYGFALLGALLFALIFAPVLGFLTAPAEHKYPARTPGSAERSRAATRTLHA